MKYCRINLKETSYSLLPNAKLLSNDEIDVVQLNNIYKKYCQYKNFESVMPIFDKEYFNNDVIAYYDNNELVAFNMIGIYNDKHVEDYQFAWTYHNPNLYLGIKSIEHECAYYKSKGVEYLYLGEVAHYKTMIQGYEELGPL